MNQDEIQRRVRTFIRSAVAFGQGEKYGGIDPLEPDFSIPALLDLIIEAQIEVLEELKETSYPCACEQPTKRAVLVQDIDDMITRIKNPN